MSESDRPGRADDASVLPTLEGHATVGEMVRAFWPFTAGRRWSLACNVVLSLGLFVLVAVLPLLTGRLLGTALASARGENATERYAAAFLDSQDVVRDAIEWGEVPPEAAGAVVLGVRAATLASLSADSDELLDSLFPGDQSYDTDRLRTDIAQQFGDERSDWQDLVSQVVSDGEIDRAETESLLDTPSLLELERAEGFNFLVSLLALDAEAEAQRKAWRASTLRIELTQFGLVVTAIVILRIVTVSLALRITLGAGRQLQDEVFRRVHDTVVVESGALGRPSMISRCTSYVDRVQTALLAAQTTGVPAFANLVLSLVLVIWIDALIGVVLSAIVLLFEVVRRAVSTRWSRLAHERLDRNTMLSEIADEAISRIPSARMSRTESFVRRRFGRQADQVSRDTARLERFGEGFAVSAFAIGQMGVVVSILIVGVARGDIVLATATAAVLYSRTVGDAIASIPGVVVDLQEAAPYMRRLQRVLLAPERRPAMERSAGVPDQGIGITFSNATFVHADGALGFRALDCTCTAPWTVVVSRSAASRAGVIAAAAGLDRLAEGEVWLGGVPGSQFDSESIGRFVATLGPSPDIVHGSLIDNITAVAPSIDADRIEDAIVRSGLDVFRRSLPAGADTLLGPEGQRVSPTDQVRIGVARLIASDAPIVVIDDPTAGWDREAADDVWTRLRAALEGRSVLIATNRLDQIGGYDEVLVLDEGRLVERGARSELLAKSRVFIDLWRRATGEVDEGLDLASIPSLSHLGDDVREHLRSRLVTERFAEGDTIYATGDLADRMFAVVDGLVELSVDDRRVASLRAGNHFGELTLDITQTRTTTARARSPVVLRSLHRLAISGGAAGMLDRPAAEQRVYRWLVRHGATTANDLETALGLCDILAAADAMVSDGIVLKDGEGAAARYRLAGVNRRRSSSAAALLDGLVNEATSMTAE